MTLTMTLNIQFMFLHDIMPSHIAKRFVQIIAWGCWAMLSLPFFVKVTYHHSSEGWCIWKITTVNDYLWFTSSILLRPFVFLHSLLVYSLVLVRLHMDKTNCVFLNLHLFNELPPESSLNLPLRRMIFYNSLYPLAFFIGLSCVFVADILLFFKEESVVWITTWSVLGQSLLGTMHTIAFFCDTTIQKTLLDYIHGHPGSERPPANEATD
ncbi:hypothetical protein DSO57_1038588 [Entomophthora muscae]|uniref:Uncharacterized protein n=1 Tax=Entomophthora muscae TaxID=34485 RepID=A0ACC2S104_9FUNG|nr:hypothetical protein DSO57_1038588 [Entomophthora muscae]